ncbi:sterol delta-7 reductase [Aureococcus anophagefferens]|nr:sterol delta-7 reductase [Aureococcus anophagefferens]
MVETRSARKAKREPNGASSPRARSPAAKARKAPAKAAPKHVEFEFGGPIGAGANVVLLPCVVVGLAVACDGAFCLGPSPLAAFAPPALGELLQPKAFAVVLGWLAFQASLQVALPGDVVEGTKLADGTRLPYLMNGHLAFWPPLAEPGDTGRAVYDFWMGRELNPRVGSFDLKCFCELRPGLIGWAVLNAGMLCKQRELDGKVLVNAFQLLYVWDALFYEKVILTTMDITTDGFGYMLAFGDLAWVPFTYCLQARYLVRHDPGLGPVALAAIVALKVVGYAVFRGANNQKDAFRRDPAKAIAEGTTFLDARRGTKLITSGYWGAARKVNYTGDWLMSLSWCLLAGVGSPVPYFYCAYFLVLLVHRALRDDHACALKYGADWPEYKKKVPYLFVPFVF